MAALSREVPAADFHCWSGHRLEVVEVRCASAVWPLVAQAAKRHLAPERILSVPEGGIVVWEPERPRAHPESSISQTLEAHHVLWMQPMRVQGGWEHYDAISFASGGDQAALTALSKSWPTQVVRRRDVGAEDVLASLFLSLRPALDAPTDKQAEALLAASAGGYYRSPRNATTAQLARRLGIGRSAFEERLRGGENRVLGAVLPALEQQRALHPGPKRRKGRHTSAHRGLQPQR